MVPALAKNARGTLGPNDFSEEQKMAGPPLSEFRFFAESIGDAPQAAKPRKNAAHAIRRGKGKKEISPKGAKEKSAADACALAFLKGPHSGRPIHSRSVREHA